MELTINVPDEAKSALEERARARGCDDLTKYVERLVTSDLSAAQALDEILAPIRRDFAESGMDEGQLDALIESERQAMWEEKQGEGA
jgi:hypothetical protein